MDDFHAGWCILDAWDLTKRQKQPMPEQEVLTYASQVLAVLDYLGRLTPPIVHRDIRPDTIVIRSKDKCACLVDFGIACALTNTNARRKQTSALVSVANVACGEIVD
jgi:serine/threonine protein kinase